MPWTQNLSVGVDSIDDQHKMWFKKAEALFEAGKNNKAKEYIGELLDFLEDYTKKHFSDEEKYMLSIHYPKYQEQKNAHTTFINELAKLRNNYNSSGGDILVILNANQMILDWLTKHISNMDKRIGEYARSH
jgi:hemerythrin